MSVFHGPVQRERTAAFTMWARRDDEGKMYWQILPHTSIYCKVCKIQALDNIAILFFWSRFQLVYSV